MHWQVALIITIGVLMFLVLGYVQMKMLYYHLKSFKPEIEAQLAADDSELIEFNYPTSEDWKNSPYSRIQIQFGGLTINGRSATQTYHRIVELSDKFNDKK